MSPSISVIVPVLNRATLITRCLDSIMNQKVKPLELIIVDNGSQDNTVEIVKNWIKENSHSSVQLKLLIETEKGAYAARQKGLENSQGDFVLFFDSDDKMMPLLLEKASEKLSTGSKIDIVCWKCRITQLDGSKRIPPFMPEKPLEGHLIHTLLRPQGFLVKKDYVDQAGGWRKKMEVWDDLELGLRLLLKDPKIIGIPEVLAEIYSQEESITGTDFSSKEGKWELTLHEMEREADSTLHPEKKKIKKIIQYRRAILAAHYYKEGNKSGAENLMKLTLMDKNFSERLWLKFSFLFTRMGNRGAWRIVSTWI